MKSVYIEGLFKIYISNFTAKSACALYQGEIIF